MAAGCSPVDRLLRDLPLRRKLALLLMVRFPGPVATDDLRAMLAEGVGGVVLYAKDGNLVDAAQVRALTAAIRHGDPAPIVAVDQEGGRVDRLGDVRGAHPSAATLAATGDPARAEAEGRGDAHDLDDLGIRLNLAPVVDVGRVYNWQLDQRTWGATPDAVVAFAGAYLRGLQASDRVVGVVKHFPGLGGVSEDPHRALPHLHADRAELDAVDWAPYRALIARGDVRAVMVSHAIVEAVDPARPASLSPGVVTGVLREALGFDGVVIADALTMDGVAASTPLDQAAIQAIQAGADWLMGPTDLGDVLWLLFRLTHAVQEGEISMRRVDASVRRVLELERRLGLLDDAGA